MHILDTPLLFALAAGCGAGARYALTLAMLRLWGTAFAWGTFFCNVLGTFFFGILWSCTEAIIDQQYKNILLSGFLGSFTTFSTFIFDAHILLKEKRYSMFFLQIASHMLCGMGAFTLALWIGKEL